MTHLATLTTRLALALLTAAASLLALPAPAAAAQSYIIVDQVTGYILDAHRPNRRHSPASLAKIASAIVTLDWIEAGRKSPVEILTITPADLAHGGANPVGLQPGDRVSLRDLLYAALMASDNTAITAVARHVGSDLIRAGAPGAAPLQAFVFQMNQLAARLRMRDTRFTNPTGLDHASPRPVSTAADLARLTRHAMVDSGFRFYVSQQTRVIHIYRGPLDLPVTLKNTNQLLGVGDIDGVKTGRTARAGDCLILSASRAPETHTEGETVYITPRRIIVVLLGSQDRFAEGRALVSKAWALYEQWRAAGRTASPDQLLR